MKLSRLCAWVLLAFFFLSPAYAFAPCAPDAAQTYTSITERYIYGAIFKVEKCGQPTSYVMGTMHSDNPALMEIYNHAAPLLGKSRTGVFEVVLDNTTIQKAQMAMFEPPASKKTLEQKIGHAYFTKFTQAMQKLTPLPPDAYQRLKPWAASVLLETPKNESDGVLLDDRLQRYAAEHKITLMGLETAEEQFAIFSGLSEAQQITMLKDTLDSLAETDELNAKLLTAYKKQDFKTISALGEESFNSITDPALRIYIKTRLLTGRNSSMTERMQPIFKSGATFVAIGALHLLGENGVLLQLEQKGYFIEPVN